MRPIAIALVASLMLAVVPAHADDPQFIILDGAKQKTTAYIKFFGIFSETFIEQLKKTERQNLAPDHWVILLSQAFSPTGEILITIYAISGDESKLPILVAVISEQSDAAVIRTAAKSTQRIVTEAAKPQDPPPSPTQKLKTKNLRTKTRAEVSIYIPISRMWYRTKI